jgi:hypothetical protein
MKAPTSARFFQVSVAGEAAEQNSRPDDADSAHPGSGVRPDCRPVTHVSSQEFKALCCEGYRRDRAMQY